MAPFPLFVVLLIFSVVQCEAWTLDEHGYPIDPPQDDEQEADGIGPCTLCQAIVKKVLKSIGNELSKDSIDKALDTICNHIGNKLKSVCLHFITKYKPKLIDAIISEQKAEQTCVVMELC